MKRLEDELSDVKAVLSVARSNARQVCTALIHLLSGAVSLCAGHWVLQVSFCV